MRAGLFFCHSSALFRLSPNGRLSSYIAGISTWSARTRLARDRRRPRGFVVPCQPLLVTTVPSGPGWHFEIKHDGYRMMSRVEDGNARMWSRHGVDWTVSFPAISRALRALPASALIDGEAVCSSEDGRSEFHALASPERCVEATLWAFDLLMRDGEDLRPLPFERRRQHLLELLSDADPNAIAFSEDHDGDGQALFEAACRMDLEGIIAKRRGSRYVSGRSRSWLKIKNPHFTRA